MRPENTSESSDWRPLAAALVSICLWSSAYVGIRAATRTIAPGALALGRLTIGSVLLGLLLLRRGAIRPTRRELGLLGLAGFLWFGLYNVALNTGERAVDAGTAAMVVNIAPLLIMALAALFLKEHLSRGLVIGGAVAFLGVLCIGLATRSGNAPWWGVVLCVVATASSAGGVVAQKPVLARVTALQVTWTCCVIGALCCLPYAPRLAHDVGAAAPGDLAWMAYLGVFPTSIAFTSWAYALARGTASRLAALAYLVPPITIGMSGLILGEVPKLVAVLGGALCLAGVIFARRGPK
ncbi:MAG TPA: DMT family transporter [Gemmatimonadales bacterium]|nr:DMT family transporter [Gemmatimonadales bacterium]